MQLSSPSGGEFLSSLGISLTFLLPYRPLSAQKATEETIERQREVRDNALAQNAVLEKYKHLLLTRKGVLGVFVSLLSGPLSRKGSARTEMDAHTIELILHLFR